MLDLDEKLLTFLRSVRVKRGVVNVNVVRAAALALIQSNPSKMHYYANFDMSRSWVQSVYRRMGYTKRLGTTGRPPVPKEIFDECRLIFLQDISSKVTEYNIPPELVINADQTPSSYVSVGKQTMAKKGSTSVPIKGLMDKRNITLTFSITHQCKLYILTRLKPLNPAILSFLKVFVLLRILNIGQMKKKL